MIDIREVAEPDLPLAFPLKHCPYDRLHLKSSLRYESKSTSY